VKRN